MSSTRRGLLLGSAALAGLTLAPFPVRQAFAAEADARVFILSDLHSAYERSAATVADIARMIAAAPGVPTLIAINGDLFERGNVVALRSGGVVDFAFIEALRALAPVVVNLGNHETALVDDMAETVARLKRAGVTVVSNMIDARTGQPFTEAVATVQAGARAFRVVGICTDELMTYRQPVRPSLRLPEPAAWGQANLGPALAGADLPVVLSHAGVAADRAFLDRIPAGGLIVGGHEHLTFQHSAANGARYVHVGSWNRGFALAQFSLQGGRRTLEVARVAVNAEGPGHPEVAAATRAAMAQHLTDQDRAIVARLAAPMSLSEAARSLCQAMARANNAHFGLMSHTTLGTGLPAGAVSAHDFASFIRFDGPMFQAEIPGPVLAEIAAGANQDGDTPLERRRGDFIYMNHEPIGAGFIYRVVTNGWTQLPANQMRYFGRDGLRFTEIPERRLRAVFQAQLPG